MKFATFASSGTSAMKWLSVALLFSLIAGCASYREGGSRTVGEFTDDVAIRTAVKSALFGDDEVSGFKIKVDVNRSVVTLFGRVPSEHARNKALSLAGNIRGVSEVLDRLTLIPE